LSIPRQRALLRAAVFGRAFASDVPAALLHQLAIKMRVLNALREPEVGVPLTMPQLEALSLPVVISRWAALPWGQAASVVDVAAVTCSMTAVFHLMSLSVAWRQAVVFSGGLPVLGLVPALMLWLSATNTHCEVDRLMVGLAHGLSKAKGVM
jgi:hypothetical protein